MKLLNVVFDLVVEQDAWAVKAASGPQKCGIIKGQGDSNDKECRAWDKEVARQDKIDMKDRAKSDKNFLSLSYDRNSFPLDRQSKKDYYNQYQMFMKNNPGVLGDGNGYNSEQKYAIVSKVLDFVRKVPRISYSVQLNRKYGLNPQSSLNDVIGVVNKMGGWSSFMSWFNTGGVELK